MPPTWAGRFLSTVLPGKSPNGRVLYAEEGGKRKFLKVSGFFFPPNKVIFLLGMSPVYQADYLARVNQVIPE